MSSLADEDLAEWTAAPLRQRPPASSPKIPRPILWT